MKTIYEAFDGKQFSDCDECLAYELGKTSPRMYNHFGDVEDCAEAAKFVFLETREAAEAFIEECRAVESSYDGIELNSLGFYIWDTANQCYVLADMDAIENVISQERARKGEGV